MLCKQVRVSPSFKGDLNKLSKYKLQREEALRIDMSEDRLDCSIIADISEDLETLLQEDYRLFVLAQDPDTFYPVVRDMSVPAGHILSIVIDSRHAFKRAFAQDLCKALQKRKIITPKEAANFRFLVHEGVLNAIEHGHLKAFKDATVNDEDWFDNYYEAIRHALNETAAGFIPVVIQIAQQEDNLCVWIEDQGEGFDHADRLSEEDFSSLEVDDLTPFGMGQKLMHSKAHHLSYDKQGRRLYFELKIKQSSTETNNSHTTPINNPPFDRKDGHVLIVDDQETNRELATFYLRSAGYTQIDQARSGEEALEKINEHTPDIILMDIVMPGLSGFDVCEKLKKNPDTAHIPLLFLSGLTDAESRTKGYKLGAVDYVNKPINREELIARTDVHIRNGLLMNQLDSYASRVAEELDRGRKFQLTLLPDEQKIRTIQDKYNLDIQSFFKASDEMAGDYWTLFDMGNNRICVITADFTGHGIVAALNMVRLHALCLEMEELLGQPETFVRALNDRLLKLLPIEHFATLIYAEINTATGEVSYISCGAPPPVHVPASHKNEAPSLLPSAGLPVGLVPSEQLDLTLLKASIDDDDTLIFYSDALIESKTRGASKPWGEAQLMEEARLLTALPARQRMHTLLETFQNKVQMPLKDDLTLLSISKSMKIITD